LIFLTEFTCVGLDTILNVFFLEFVSKTKTYKPDCYLSFFKTNCVLKNLNSL
jgi:hypothetical protein